MQPTELVLSRQRLVSVVFKKIWIVTAGIVPPNAVGTPPVHVTTKSPINSDKPSARTGGLTPPFATQLSD